MAAPHLESFCVKDLLWCEENVFEDVIDNLTMRSLLDLVAALQEAMSEEQRHFDELSNQLQQCHDPESVTFQKTRTALCTSQMKLTSLCNKNMRCFTQQAIRAKKEQWKTTKSVSNDHSVNKRNPPMVTIQKMSTPSVVSNEERSASGFRESLRFFQKQEKTEAVNNNFVNVSKKITMNGERHKVNGSTRNANSMPSVDIILSNVRNICATKNVQNLEVNLNESVIKCNGHSDVNSLHTVKSHAKITPIVQQPKNGFSSNDVRSRLQSAGFSTTCNDQEKGSLVSRFNPIFELENDNCENGSFNSVIGKNGVKTILNSSFSESFEKAISESSSANHSSKSGLCERSEIIRNNLHQVTDLASQRTDNNVKSKVKSITNKTDYRNSLYDVKGKSSVSCNSSATNGATNSPGKKTNQVAINGNSSLQFHLTKNSSDISLESANEEDISDVSLKSEKDSSSRLQDKGEEDSSEKACNSLESDYDSKDFVVHKTSFSEDYIEVMSEDACSSITEDYEVEHPDDLGKSGPDIPSPDYVSDDEDEDYRIHHYDGDEDDNDDEFVDNSSQYVADPRRYVYYLEDKELEVIPEEDEDDLEDENSSSSEDFSDQEREIYNRFTMDGLNINGVKSSVDCDSGVADASASSGPAEISLEEDTDSAQSSLQLCSERSSDPVLEIVEELIVEEPIVEENIFEQPIVEHNLEARSESGWSISPIVGNVTEEIQLRRVYHSWDLNELVTALYTRPGLPENYRWPRIDTEAAFVELLYYSEPNPQNNLYEEYYNKEVILCIKDGILTLYPAPEGSSNPDFTTFIVKMELLGAVVRIIDGSFISVRTDWQNISFRPNGEQARKSIAKVLRLHAHVWVKSHPALTGNSLLTIFKDVLIIDVGGASIRAGILSSSPTLPECFFPAVVARNKESLEVEALSFEALNPNLRPSCALDFPFCASDGISFVVEIPLLISFIRMVAMQMNISLENYKLLLCLNVRVSDAIKNRLARQLLENLGLESLAVAHETIATAFGYRENTGLIVDVGHRVNVFPIIGGYFPSTNLGHSKFGAKYVLRHLHQSVIQQNDISMIPGSENYLLNYILEEMCFVAQNYAENAGQGPETFKMELPVAEFFSEGPPPIRSITLDVGRYEAIEGIFRPSIWGYDTPSLRDLIKTVYDRTAVDNRKMLVENIFLSGGLTLLPGFPERLEKEISVFTPGNIIPKVHASKFRYHMSYIGCHYIASEPGFVGSTVRLGMREKRFSECLDSWKM